MKIKIIFVIHYALVVEPTPKSTSCINSSIIQRIMKEGFIFINLVSDIKLKTISDMRIGGNVFHLPLYCKIYKWFQN